ncbi:protein kinase [Actinocorallia sp. API 0066]|uniref:serine/threonine-protein kinase n=1 Tax=Actinocorallia sp. API 0066 TaxID=2896846 RepID=UPI001E500878|nr:serine/threonine-protein kinase [Actinocorallia sp. API 0066]MCD0448254.1 protein kinase [Actinocorallia sp. API 0066]
MGEALRPDDPRELGRFPLVERLGEGGQGIVYLGRDPETSDLVAVKVLKAADDAEARERLEREMNAAMQVRLQYCIARVIGFDFEGARPYIVTEYVDGPSLFERVAESGPLRGGDLERLLIFTAQALVTIHGSGVVHRDLKPANVLLGRDGPRVVDFGIARHVDHHTRGQLVGTPSYLAPELLREERASRASDIWAWACTMVFAATGYPPFGPFDNDGGGVAAILGRIMHAQPRLGAGVEEFEPLLRRCLDKDPTRRPTARQVRDQLESALEADVPHGDSAPLPFSPLPVGPPGPGFAWRNETVDRGLTPPPQHTHPSHPTFPPTPVGIATPPPFDRRPPEPPPGSHRVRNTVVGVLAVAVVAAGGYFGVTGLLDGGGGNGPGGGAAVPASLTGQWSGNLILKKDQQETYYRMTLTLFPGQNTGDSQLDSGNICSGTVTVVNAGGNSADLDLAHDIATCPDGALTLTTTDAGALVAFTGAGGVTGTGELTRAD